MTTVEGSIITNRNRHASVLAGYSAYLKEMYKSMSLLLEKIHYCKYNWRICGDLKVITILMGMQQSTPSKYCTAAHLGVGQQ